MTLPPYWLTGALVTLSAKDMEKPESTEKNKHVLAFFATHIMEGDLMSMTAAERKALAREDKRKRQEELRKNEDKFEYEEYNVQKKAFTTQSQKEKQEQARREKEEREKEQRKKPAASGKLSKPEPARSPFLFFKEANPKLDSEALKTAWATLPESDKQAYKVKSQNDKQREKEEKEKWNEAQALKAAQQSSKKGKERR
eukprot:TRINITY_DN3745_c0_g5_i1.p1 TRINITY_DN3745_c0_g5~~TRINITY_DN3745_c0_g5_i1.p1  ORF type:complete len:199 (+),score=64.37 TRINITY_DN3745_c0_g5_i1:132-728(+)